MFIFAFVMPLAQLGLLFGLGKMVGQRTVLFYNMHRYQRKVNTLNSTSQTILIRVA